VALGRLKSEGGGHDPDNLVTVCGAHHRALHRGLVTIEGRLDAGLRFLHADGSSYGLMPTPLAADAASKAFRALRALGFRESEARRALAEATHVGTTDDVEALVRRCLGLLTEHLARAS
jgi:Holliday junction resolvasome RuvABC DNA-binding subunit